MDQTSAKISCPACGKKHNLYYSRVGERYRYECLCGEVVTVYLKLSGPCDVKLEAQREKP